MRTPVERTGTRGEALVGRLPPSAHWEVGRIAGFPSCWRLAGYLFMTPLVRVSHPALMVLDFPGRSGAQHSAVFHEDAGGVFSWPPPFVYSTA